VPIPIDSKIKSDSVSLEIGVMLIHVFP